MWNSRDVNGYTFAGGEPISGGDFDGRQGIILGNPTPSDYDRRDAQMRWMRATGQPFAPAPPGWVTPAMNRVTGGFMVVGGAAETTIGVLGGVTTSPTLIGAAGFGALAAHGGLTTGAGMHRLITGEGTRTLTAQGLDYVTGNQTASDVVDGLAGAAGSFGGTFVLRQAAAGNYLFRGTTEGFAGSPALQSVGNWTPVTTDPLKATLFAISANEHAPGVVQMASRSQLSGLVGEGNYLAQLESAFGVNLSPLEFAQRAQSISLYQARSIFQGMGEVLPQNIGGAGMSTALANYQNLSLGQTSQFLSEAIPGVFGGINSLGGFGVAGNLGGISLSKH